MTRLPTRVLAVVVLVGLTVAGCLDFVQPEPRDARLSVTVQVTDGRPARGRITGAFRPGTGPDGSQRSVADPGIGVFGTTVGPTGTVSAGDALSYRDSLALSVGDLDRMELVIQGPRLFRDHGRVSVSLPLVWRAGPDTVAPPPTGDLALPLRGTPGAPPGDGGGLFWSLTVRRAGEGGSLYGAQGRDVVPDTIEVPRAVLEAGSSDVLVARLQVSQNRSLPAGEAGYSAAFGLSTEIVWHVVPE